MKGDAELEALIRAVDGDERLRGEVSEALDKFRRRREKEIADRQAAELLPLGRTVAAERLGVAPSTVYKMVRRWRKLSTVRPAA